MGSMSAVVVAVLCAFAMHAGFLVTNAQLSPTFYNETCPTLNDIVFNVVSNASLTDPRIGASLLRLHFHDCFVQVRNILYMHTHLSCFSLYCTKPLHISNHQLDFFFVFSQP